MRGLQREKKTKLIYSPLAMVLLLALLVILSISLIKMIQKSSTTKEARDRYQADLEILEKQGADLQADIEFFATERGMEEEIRDRFPVVKEGEELIVIVDTSEEENEQEEEKKGLFRRLFR